MGSNVYQQEPTYGGTLMSTKDRPEDQPNDITIPPKAFTAAELAYTEALSNDEDPIRAACLAMIRAWPGTFVYQYGDDGSHSIILPLPTEKETRG